MTNRYEHVSCQTLTLIPNSQLRICHFEGECRMLISCINFLVKKTKDNSRRTQNDDEEGNDDCNADSGYCELEEVTEKRLLNTDEFFLRQYIFFNKRYFVQRKQIFDVYQAYLFKFRSKLDLILGRFLLVRAEEERTVLRLERQIY